MSSAPIAPMDFAPLMGEVAKRLRGEANKKLSRPDDARYGNNGSLTVDVKAGTFYDFEADHGGGVLDFIQHERKCSVHQALTWLEEQGLKDREAKEVSKVQPIKAPAFYDYVDEHGEVAYRVQRLYRDGAKQFLQHGPDGQGGFSAKSGGMDGVKRLPYRLPELLASDPSRLVFVVEGEKDADRLASMGLIATTNSGGAGKWLDELTPYFEGRHVAIIADNDSAGLLHSADVYDKLSAVTSSVGVVQLTGVQNKGDVSDWLDAGNNIANLIEWGEAAIAEAQYDPDKLVKATPFAWRHTSEIPKRRWLYGKHLLRKFVSLDVAAGGVGKSSLKIGEALAMATGRDLYDKGLPEGALNVWMWNLEDPHDEIERRLHATAQRFKITPAEIADRLFVDSGRDQPLVMATEGPDGAMIVRPVVDALIEEMIARKIDVLQIDPFISSHAVSENDNNAIDLVAREWNVVAERTGAAINLVHHVRKGNGTEATADSARGASSLIGKARSVQVYNRMSEDEAAKLNVPEEERFFYFRVDNDKANLAPPERGDWYRMNNEDLSNGDSVGVACSWTPPDAFDGITVRHLYEVQKAVAAGKWRENVQTKDAWVGHCVANVLGIDVDQKHARKRISILLNTWISEGMFEVVEEEVGHRKTAKFVVVLRWAEL